MCGLHGGEEKHMWDFDRDIEGKTDWKDTGVTEK